MGRKKDVDKIPIEKLVKSLSPEQQEFLKIAKAGRTDPILFANKILGLMLHPGQELWLLMTTKTQTEKAFEIGIKLEKWKNRIEFDSIRSANPDMLKNILVPSNRWGKTFVTSGVKHLWYNFYKIGVTGDPEHIADTRCGTLNLSPHSNQCQAGYDYILDILQSKLTFDFEGKSYRNKCIIPDFLVGSNSQKRIISFKNGTTYRAVPTGEDQASSVAGTRYLYISYDECAQSLHLKEELPAKIMSRLIDFGGALDLVSTPEVDKPSHQYFFHIAKLGLKGMEGWWTLIGKITDNVFLGKKEVESICEAIRTTDPAKYRQVKYGDFVTTGKKMFDSILVERLWDSFDHTGTNIILPVVDHKYLISADWGFSDTGDPSVFYVIDYTELLNEKIAKHLRKMRVVFREAIRGGSPIAVMTRARMIQRDWNGGLFIHDSSSMGGVIIKKMLREMNMTNIIDFSASGDKMNMLFILVSVMSENRKPEIGAEGKIIDTNPDFGRIRSFHIPELEEQLGNYQYNPAKGVSDKRIEQDEVMSLGQAIWYIETKILKNKLKDINFNPLATSVEHIFPKAGAQTLNIKSITIPEKRIF